MAVFPLKNRLVSLFSEPLPFLTSERDHSIFFGEWFLADFPLTGPTKGGMSEFAGSSGPT